jgi:isopenicillin N synthase-like dioxygenase
MAVNFTSIALVDYHDSLSPDTKPRFLSALRSALIDVGFFYLQNPPIEVELQEALVKTTGAFFDLPTKQKLELDVARSKHFRGYACAGAEKTATISDQRETLTVCLMTRFKRFWADFIHNNIIERLVSTHLSMVRTRPSTTVSRGLIRYGRRVRAAQNIRF